MKSRAGFTPSPWFLLLDAYGKPSFSALRTKFAAQMWFWQRKGRTGFFSTLTGEIQVGTISSAHAGALHGWHKLVYNEIVGTIQPLGSK